MKGVGVQNNVEKLLLVRRALESNRLNRRDIVQIALPQFVKLLHKHTSPASSIDEKITCASILEKCIPYLDVKRKRPTHKSCYTPFNNEDPNLGDDNEVITITFFCFFFVFFL